MTPIFALPRKVYDSYADVRTLIALNGYSTCYVDEIDNQKADTTYVIVSPLYLDVEGLVPLSERQLPSLATIVHWNLERFDIAIHNPWDLTSATVAALDRSYKYAHYVWLSDKSLYKAAQRAAAQRAMIDDMGWADSVPARDGIQYVTFGGDSRLGLGEPGKPIYDVCPLAYLWGRRADIVHQIKRQGRMRIAPPAYGDIDRAKVLLHSKCVLNLHQYGPMKPIAPTRFVLAAANMVPLFSEEIDDLYPLVEGEHIMTGPPDKLWELIPKWLKDPVLVSRLARNLWYLYCEEWTFRRGVEEGLKELENLQLEGLAGRTVALDDSGDED